MLVICFLWFVLCLCVYFCDLDLCWVFPYCLVVSNSQVIGCEDPSKMTYTVSGGVLNSTQSNPFVKFVLSAKLLLNLCCQRNCLIPWQNTLISSWFFSVNKWVITILLTPFWKLPNSGIYIFRLGQNILSDHYMWIMAAWHACVILDISWNYSGVQNY